MGGSLVELGQNGETASNVQLQNARLMGIAPPTHRKIAFSETHLLRIFGGRIVEDHSLDLVSVMISRPAFTDSISMSGSRRSGRNGSCNGSRLPGTSSGAVYVTPCNKPELTTNLRSKAGEFSRRM
jgi:hypothetical protein